MSASRPIDLTASRNDMDFVVDDESMGRGLGVSDFGEVSKEEFAEGFIQGLENLGVSPQFLGSVRLWVKEDRITHYRIALIGSWIGEIIEIAMINYPDVDPETSESETDTDTDESD